MYQFIPNHKKIVDKLIGMASSKVIISEPIKNISSSKIPLISTLARYAGNPGTGHSKLRFNKETFEDFFYKNYSQIIEKIELHSGGRELLVVLDIKKTHSN